MAVLHFLASYSLVCRLPLSAMGPSLDLTASVFFQLLFSLFTSHWIGAKTMKYFGGVDNISRYTA